MNIDDLFRFWDKLSSVKPDLILFIGFVFLVIKFKDVSDLYFKIKFKRADEYKEAKKLLELSGYADTRDMQIVNDGLRGVALTLITNGVDVKYRKLCYYLMYVASEKEKHINTSIFKCLQFIESNGDRFYFNDGAYTKWQVRAFIVALVLSITMLLAGNYDYGNAYSVFKISWVMNVSFVIFFISFAYLFFVKKPDSGDIKVVKDLLSTSNIADFNKFNDMSSKIII